MSRRADGRGHWPRGQSRSDLADATAFVAACCREAGSVAELARRLGVAPKCVYRWSRGQRRITAAVAARMAEAVIEPSSSGSLPIYAPTMALDGNTRVGGVGEFSRRTAKGESECLG